MYETITPPGSLRPSHAAPKPFATGLDAYVYHRSAVASSNPNAAIKESLDEFNAEPTFYFRIKPLVDRLITAALMPLALPLMLFVAVVILVTNGRPVFFRQVRVGKNGRLFRIWKFRSMQVDAERETGAIWSDATDARVTRLGRWLRCSHLDELPQFLNVLAGDMNIVGPRPERPEFVESLAKDLPAYLKRTQVRPGITGLAQLRLGYDESVAGIPEKVACDLQYIRSASFLTDIALLASTLPHIARQLYDAWSRTRQQKPLDRPSSMRVRILSIGFNQFSRARSTAKNRQAQSESVFSDEAA